ncbi:nitrate reductase molybdenum cofactor assembly chaperone [Abyssicoccus albus]|uniref:nitrate reductase molybdenum cofactor assembly chaperone n=1 Tax=Abyssicoccus albus TaxID=1817405 RepID=UPI00097E2A31|nr:nitrate reductase molybdenum cofactor assembly chaperone [Abyssicoccus albus]AQL56883.1 nitrate reductase molybdenum cofactor assembly chaperone [Abyssicoccus albus]
MINFEQLARYKDLFKFYSMHFDYPEKLNYHPKVFEVSDGLPESIRSNIKKYEEAVFKLSIEENQAKYIDTFDFEKKNSLFMTYANFEDGKERGQMLAKLKVLYEMFGLMMPDNELSDYLPLMCEFIYASNWEDDPRRDESFSLLVGVIEDGSYHLLKSLEKEDNHYVYLVKALRETFKHCMKPQQVSKS